MGDGTLTAFWISFPRDSTSPRARVTAWSQTDAFCLLEEQGYDFHLRASEVAVRENVTIDNESGTHSAEYGPNDRWGVWYPCLNIGFGGPRRL